MRLEAAYVVLPCCVHNSSNLEVFRQKSYLIMALELSCESFRSASSEICRHIPLFT